MPAARRVAAALATAALAASCARTVERGTISQQPGDTAPAITPAATVSSEPAVTPQASPSRASASPRTTARPPSPIPAPPPPPPSAGSGVRGIVQAGPTCPVERIDSPCPPRPVQTDVTIERASGGVAAKVRSGSDGRFQAPVPPGNYVVKADPGQQAMRCSDTAVTVSPNSYADVVVDCDTGIR